MRQGALIAGKYRLQRLIGDGATGEVWAAQNERTEREVAIKLILRADRELRERAIREARVLGRVSHRSVVEVLDAGETDKGDPFLVMPLLTGETVGERVRREGRVPPPRAAAIALEAARGLAAAHAAGIIHRDLKPSNIFLHRDPETGLDLVKVLDFGVSKLVWSEGPPTTRTGDIVGSPAYMSPEQARADRALDQRTDIWSLGVVLFEMLSGRRPFTSRNIAVIADIVSAPVPPIAALVPDLDPSLAAVVMRCLERDVDRRVQTAAELVALLRPCAGGEDLWGGAESRPRPPASAASPMPSSGMFQPVKATLVDGSRPSQLWREAVAAARASQPAEAAPGPAKGPSRAESASAAYAMPGVPGPVRVESASSALPENRLAATMDDTTEEELSTAEMHRSPLRSPTHTPPAPAGRRLGPLILVGVTSALTILVLVLAAIGLGKQLLSGKGGAAPPPAGAQGSANAEARPTSGRPAPR